MNPVRISARINCIFRHCFLGLTARRASSIAHGRQTNPPNKFKLPDTPARTRFAPSPTGYLHLGSLRTALYNYLLAKATGGQFILRLEDTDKKRTVLDAERRLYEDLRWAGLQWDEGPEVGGSYGPYRQSERTDIYRENAARLVNSGHAYRCFCSAERLASLTEQRSKLGLPTDYDRTCYSIPAAESEERASKGEKHTIRLKVPDVYPEFKDIIYGAVGREKKRVPHRLEDAWEDPVLLKGDGLPTYNLANVVDDHHMHITHVIRGTEWMAMTPKHLTMYEAFGWKAPQYAHVPLLTDQGGAKLSKRTGSIDVRSYRRDGIIPEALLNFVALLGWSHSAENDLMNLEELMGNFTLKFTKGNAAVNSKKLEFLHRKHIERLIAQDNDSASIKSLVEQIEAAVLSQQENASNVELILDGRDLKTYIVSILKVDGMNFKTVDDFVSRNNFLFNESSRDLHTMKSDEHPFSPAETKIIADSVLHAMESEELLDLKAIATQAAQEILESGKSGVANIRSVQEQVNDHPTEELKSTIKKVYHYLRGCLAKGKSGMGLKDMIEILGYSSVRRRLTKE